VAIAVKVIADIALTVLILLEKENNRPIFGMIFDLNW